jgi:hypothetical protein
MKVIAAAVLLLFSAAGAKGQCAVAPSAVEEQDSFTGTGVVFGSISSIYSQGQGVVGYQSLLSNAQYGYASQPMSGAFSIEATVTTLDADGNPGQVSLMAETAANEFVQLVMYRISGQVYVAGQKIETNPTTGAETISSVFGQTAVTLPVQLSLDRVSGTFNFYQNSNYLGSTTLTSDTDPTLVGIEADGGSNLSGVTGEATFSNITLYTGYPNWTNVPVQLSLSTAGGYALFATITPAVQAGTLSAGPLEVAADTGTNGQCGSTPAAYLGYEGEIKDPAHSVTYLGTQETGTQTQNCATGCWAFSNDTGGGLQGITLVHGDTYTFVGTTTINIVGSNGQRASATATRTVQLNP